MLIGQELIKIKPSIKEVKKLLNKKEYNSKTFKNQELDKLQNIDTKDIKTSFGIIGNNEDSYNAKDRIDKEIRIGYQAGKKQYAAGYKGHIVTDVESGAILKPIMTFANTSDISAVNKLIENMDNIKSFGGDKAYKSKEIDELLKSKKVVKGNVIYVAKDDIGSVIGKKGRWIKAISKAVGAKVLVKELKKEA